ncbi:hypothetical protein ACR6C2_25075 [Streptomyces sp. INA 01156]
MAPYRTRRSHRLGRDPARGRCGPPQVPAPAPAGLAPPTAATLDAAYAAHRADAEAAARMAADHGDRRRAVADRALAGPTGSCSPSTVAAPGW